MPTFTSSAIKQAEYDPFTRVLAIWFVSSGGPYFFDEVPDHVFEALCLARSKGKYFDRHIRDRYLSHR